MRGIDMVLFREELRLLEAALDRLIFESNARAVFLVERNGQLIATAGEASRFDSTSLASLAAGNVAATDGLASLIGESEFSGLYHEGRKDHLFLSIVARRAILVVVFDDRTSLGLVRLRVKRANGEISRIFADMERRSGEERSSSAPAMLEISEEDIDALFTD